LVLQHQGAEKEAHKSFCAKLPQLEKLPYGVPLETCQCHAPRNLTVPEL